MKNNQYIRQAQYKKGFAKMWIILGLVIFISIGLVVVVSRGCWISGKFYFHSTCNARGVIGDPILLEQTSTADWKTYKNEKSGFEFQYPENLKLSESNGKVTLSHSIPYENRGECDMTADGKTYSTLTDFKLSFEKRTGNLTFEYTDGEYNQGGLKGSMQYTGAEGCGELIYYFPVGDSTLVVKRDAIQATSGISTVWEREKILAISGAISKEESQRIFDKILSTFKFTKSVIQSELTKETVLSLLKGDLFDSKCGGGEYKSCKIDITKVSSDWLVTVTYDGLYDDSVKAIRYKTAITYQDGKWISGNVSKTQQCWPNRGHQDFSSELCV